MEQSTSRRSTAPHDPKADAGIRHLLIGTAGHVDHGKTTLIRCLTGIDADRLPEEKRRGMTIDIGFAHFNLEGLGEISIVDVPGHERFIHNMLVGAFGMDLALLVVAADEGVMPQTKEHLAILELLPVTKMVVALTRIDLADEATVAVTREETAVLLSPTRFAESPILRVSGETREGMEDLKAALKTALSQSTVARPSGPWYMPIDRIFEVRGRGVVVTGTPLRGEMGVGQPVEINPGGMTARIRQIQIHGKDAATSGVGRRTALNLAGVKLEQVRRGMSVGEPGATLDTRAIDVEIRWLEPKKDGTRVRVSIGADEVMARLRLSSQGGLDHLSFERSASAAEGQPIIIRGFSTGKLLGGGRVLVPQAMRGPSLAPALAGSLGLSEAILSEVGDGPNGVETAEICRRLGRTPQQLGDAFQALTEQGKLLGFAGLWMSAEALREASRRFEAALQDLHTAEPRRPYQPRELVVRAAHLEWQGKSLDRLVSYFVNCGSVEASGTFVRNPGFQIQLTDRQASLLDRVIECLERERIDSPAPRQISSDIGIPIQAVQEIIRLGVDAGRLVDIAPDVFYSKPQLNRIQAEIASLAEKGSFTASEVRDHFGSSRRFVIPLLEYFDSIQFTVRIGDSRVLRA